MKPFRSLQTVVAFVATLPLLCPTWVHRAVADDLPPAASVSPRDSVRPQDVRPVDVVLDIGNHISGRVVTSLNQPIVDVELIVTQGRQEVARVFTNEFGVFQVRLPRGGVYVFATARSMSVVRTWTATAAPPTAVETITLIERLVIRGQDENCEPKRGHGKGLMLLAITAALAAAIAIPLATIDFHEDHEKHKATSP